ncbi:MAG: pilus assembly protein PilM [Candidatus Paceibacterota bacterium]|jgi:type IV pilus assembly protein PilM
MKANFFKKLFYIPDYLSLPVAGVEICNKSIKYIEFFNKKGVFSIKNFGEVSIAPNVVKDGDVLNRDALAKALIEVKNNISSDFVKVSIPEEKTYIFDTQIPKEAKTDIREALEFKIEENVPLKLEEVYFEYEVVNHSPKTMKDLIVNVSVIPKMVISDYTEVLNQANLYPLSFELGSKMIANSVIPKDDMRNFIIIKIKDDSTVFIAVIKGVVRFTSTVAIGENMIRERLLKTGLFSDELISGNFFASDFSFETTYTKESYESLVNIFSVLKDEAERFNGYIEDKFSDPKSPSAKKVYKIILCGRSSTLPGLAKHINQNIKTEVVLANAWSNVFDTKEFVANMKFNDSLDFVTPIGLVVSSYKQTNA